MNMKEMFTEINKFLNAAGCTHIEFYEPRDVEINSKEGVRVFDQIFKISFLNSNYKFINFFLRFNSNNVIYRADNHQAVSYQIDVNGKSKEETEQLLDMYLERESNLGFQPMEPSLQSSPVRFLDTLDVEQINIYIEILKYKNTAKQSLSITELIYFDDFKSFMNEFLPLFI
ncbi:hypothetical protein SCHIN_v1c07440 [Spiroplasma chinense]|uniref:Uncharacterized protein n=1 Tax=Spiroplasma chinense TaxID=216932 RepID=A0A5B9Y5G7_9MOLU|nr:hypothetical protein [Spiroplasma chinense]QEH61939.1 hypothetical protein SCHIN_v1c07440 [Spiroplasma chinense]